MDRTEVTVGRLRAAFAAGFKGKPPLANDGPLANAMAFDDVKGCTYSKAPIGREGYAATCTNVAEARAFCRSEGGDLPTEVQWEHAATMAGRARKTRYPWGNDEGDCKRSATSRAILGGTSPCMKEPIGPDDVNAHPNDVTPFGALGLGGGVSEWVRDSYADYASSCWASATIANPMCAEGKGTSWRGASWMTPLYWSTYRVGFTLDLFVVFVGFRCAYEVKP